MKAIPLAAIPSQQIQVTLNGQNCQVNVYQKTTGLYFDLTVNGSPVTSGVRCLNFAELLADRQYLFTGDFLFFDTQGDTDPVYTGLGGASARYQLSYIEPTDGLRV